MLSGFSIIIMAFVSGCISWPSVCISRHIHVRCAFWEGAGRTVIIIPHKYTTIAAFSLCMCVRDCKCVCVSVIHMAVSSKRYGSGVSMEVEARWKWKLNGSGSPLEIIYSLVEG